MSLQDVPVALIEACREGDRVAVERLLRQISPDIYRIVYSMLRDHDDTDEVVQETLIRLFRYIAKLKEPEKFASWTMRITVSQVQTWRMKRGRLRMYEISDGMDSEDSVIAMTGTNAHNPRDLASRRQIHEQVESAMATLPDRQQTAVVLFEIEGCSIKEIAQTMACSEGAVKFNIHEARKKLQRRLGYLVQGLFRKVGGAVQGESQVAKAEDS